MVEGATWNRAGRVSIVERGRDGCARELAGGVNKSRYIKNVRSNGERVGRYSKVTIIHLLDEANTDQDARRSVDVRTTRLLCLQCH